LTLLTNSWIRLQNNNDTQLYSIETIDVCESNCSQID